MRSAYALSVDLSSIPNNGVFECTQQEMLDLTRSGMVEWKCDTSDDQPRLRPYIDSIRLELIK
jgi:hypothetical protein